MNTAISIINLSNKKVRAYFFQPKSYFYAGQTQTLAFNFSL